MIRVCILLVGIGIGFGVARLLFPGPSPAPAPVAALDSSCRTDVPACSTPGATAVVAAPTSDTLSTSHASANETPRGDPGAVQPRRSAEASGDEELTDVFSRMGVRKGDVILRVNEHAVYSPFEALSLLQALTRAGAPVKELLVRRGGQEMTLRP